MGPPAKREAGGRDLRRWQQVGRQGPPPRLQALAKEPHLPPAPRLLHPLNHRAASRESKEALALERKYLDLCEEKGRKCKFVNFSFNSNRNFGEKVCQYETYGNVESIVLGKRGYVSDFRRVLMGSSTQSVLNACSMPITIVNEKEKQIK